MNGAAPWNTKGRPPRGAALQQLTDNPGPGGASGSGQRKAEPPVATTKRREAGRCWKQLADSAASYVTAE
jgi:hypothetical protein